MRPASRAKQRDGVVCTPPDDLVSPAAQNTRAPLRSSSMVRMLRATHHPQGSHDPWSSRFDRLSTIQSHWHSPGKEPAASSTYARHRTPPVLRADLPLILIPGNQYHISEVTG